MDTGIIYKITNNKNNKVYIGITTRTLEVRWKEHLRQTSQKIDIAIREIGKENFNIEEIERCSIDKLDEREQFWISYYNSFDKGYNLTYGGRGNKILFKPDKIKEVLILWNNGYGQKKIAELTNLNVETVRNYLWKNGITKEDIKTRHGQLVAKSKAKFVNQYDQNGNFIKTWESMAEAARAFGAKRCNNIVLVCKGERKSAYGYKWKYTDK